MPARIRKDDMVEVIAGAHRGAKGKVLRLIPERLRVVVEGVNMVYRHVRRSRKNPQGGRIQKEAAIHLSNVQPIDPKTGRGTRVRFRTEGGVKQRISVAGSVLGEVKRAAVAKRRKG